MKPTVISNANVTASSSSSSPQADNCINIPISHEFRGQSTPRHQKPHGQQYVADEQQASLYGSPGSHGRFPQQQIPTHFQRDFNFEPDMETDIFPRSRLGRITHDPFGDFGGSTHFGFPQFNTLGRRRINSHNDDDFFNRLPSEFRQYIPESFTERRSSSGISGNPMNGATMSYSQEPIQQQSQHFYNTNTKPLSPSKKVCDAAIQTEDPSERCEVDHATNTENLNQHGLRNTMDLGIKSPLENEIQGPRSSSAPPMEQELNQQQSHTHPEEVLVKSLNRPTPLPQQHQFGTQTSPQTGIYSGQLPLFDTTYYDPQQSHTQQKQNTPSPPQTPSGSYIRTIPIFVEGRSEPIINNKDIPIQRAQSGTATGSTNSRSFTLPKEQQYQAHRPTPLNTQQHTVKQSETSGGPPPQTPHTVDTINKIQDIQRDVLDLMSRVEKFSGTRANKEYMYLDEMLTRNLLKLDNIDTNGKESIRLARKEAIKCIQASINVLEAKAEENKKASQDNVDSGKEMEQYKSESENVEPETATDNSEKSLKEEMTIDLVKNIAVEQTAESTNVNKTNEPIPLPPPECKKFNEVIIEDCPEDNLATTETLKKSDETMGEKK